MKKTGSLVLAVFLLFFMVSCNGSSDEIYSQAMAGTASEGSSAPVSSEASRPGSRAAVESAPSALPKAVDYTLTGQLTVRDFIRDPNPGELTALEIFAEEFMELHPNVTVTVDYYTSDTTEIQQSKKAYSAQTSLELLSGDANYLLFSPKEQMDLIKLSRSGVLTDLRPYWENDPEINPEDYFTPVLDAFSVGGKLASIPMSFAFDGLFLNRQLMEELEVDLDSLAGLDYKMLLDWHGKAVVAEPKLQPTYGGWLQESFFDVERSAYLDLENQTATFSSPEFLEFLTRTGEINEPEAQLDEISRAVLEQEDFVNAALQCKATGKPFPVKYLYYVDRFMEEGSPSLACLSGISPASMAYFSYPLDYLAGPYPWLNTKGQLPVISMEELCIPASIADPALAWEFIKYCLGERDSLELPNKDIFTYYFPLNKQNFMKQMEVYSEGGGHQYRYMAMLGKPMGRFDGKLALEKLEGFLSLPLIPRKLYSIDAKEYLEEFYIQKLITAEECAEKIQGRAEIWLNE